MMPPRRVSVAILSWNGRQHLETCLAALAEQDDPGVEWEVLVLDNGSTDGTADWLRARFPRGRRELPEPPRGGRPSSPPQPLPPSPSPLSPPAPSPSPPSPGSVHWLLSPSNLGFC
ncbi:MAG: glycosyltransferase, partial [Acidobacteria bacterium]|nr:glycosyltransferase [Acidobacteriota bacterium]